METILKWILAGEVVAIIGLTTALVLSLCKGKKAPRTQTAVQSISAQDVLLQGLAKHCGRFTGLYEALYMSLGSNQVPDAYHEWHIRMMKLQVDPQFHQVFIGRFPENGTPAQVQDLITQLQAAGISRETTTTHVANAETLKHYIYLGGDNLCPGQTYNVVKPCWVCNGVVIEQGVLMSGK